MLVLTRKMGEKIHIGQDIVVKVIRTTGNVVKIGIDAPRHVRVLRAELRDFSVVEPVANGDVPAADERQAG